jgi:hypothetical protein
MADSSTTDTTQHLLERELEALKEMGGGKPPRSLFGLALSGGGIRSATFNLGLLQGLHSLGLLPCFHYLSTVSGGGYIGGFWSAWRHHRAPANPLFPKVEEGSDHAEPEEIRHLREFSNFLSPRLGVLSVDTGRLVAAFLTASIPSLLTALSLIALGFLGWLVLVGLLFTRPERQGTLPGLLGLSSAAMAVLLLGNLFVTELAWRHQEKSRETWRSYGVIAVAALLMTLAAWRVLGAWAFDKGPRSGELPLLRESQPWTEWAYLLTPSAAWAAGALALIVGRWLTSRAGTALTLRPWITSADRAISRLVFLAASWAGLTLFWCLGVLLGRALTDHPAKSMTGLGGATAVLVTAFVQVQRLLSKTPNKPQGGKALTRFKPLLPQLLAYGAVALLVLGMVALLFVAHQGQWLTAVVVPVVIIPLVSLVAFSANRLGLHAFYRSRIARAYLGAANPAPNGHTEEQAGDDFALDTLQGGKPLHLLCCAANDLAPEDPMSNLHRGAQSAVFSRVGFSVGHDGAPWTSERLRDFVPTLASVMTASGAAFNSHMGSLSKRLGPAVTFLMTAFNLRLGLWWPHPTCFRPRRFVDQWLVGWPFFKELFGRSRARSRHVLLSDGGHFENMALYELVRRKCRYIVASDCGMDPDIAFNDFGNFVRRVRADFGVQIEIDLSPLQPGPGGLARQPMVAGDIHYPDGDMGVLLLFKPTLVGTESPDIAQYKKRNAAFPHQSTGDQFFDEAQWESYRRLGEHAAQAAFRPVVLEHLGAGQDIEDWGARVFARARREWLPRPAGYEERISRLSARIAELDTILAQGNCRMLLQQVMRELDALDRQPRVFGGATERLSPEVVLPALHAIRRALLVMEEVFLSEDLELRHNHPLYLGVINYFARWAYAPLFRMWWPLLKTLYPQRFVRFLEERYGLAVRVRETVSRGQDMRAGFAMECWRQQHGDVPDDQALLSFELEVDYQAHQPVYRIQAAQLRLERSEDVVLWKASDFYVPPGLWGVGIGERFLRALASDPRVLGNAAWLAVRIEMEATAPAGKRKAWADEAQLYRSCGFMDAAFDEQRLVLTVWDEAPISLREELRAAVQPRAHWLVRRVAAP